MDSGRWRDVERVLDLAFESDPDDWPRIVREQCGADEALRHEVESLLSRHSTAQRFLESPPIAAAAALVREARTVFAPRAPIRAGIYRIIRQIGQGGTSDVYLAERDDGQFTQQVALKLLRPSRDSEIDQVRFRAERQILAALNHPNIARLLDGGVTDDGMPYLVMELVDGEPIDEYCRARAMSVRDRLSMFVLAAEATQFAHRNLVVHRDLKPSNILVTPDGQVKLLDFGLAKLLDPFAQAPGPLTTQRWMTPEYAAPEQVRGHTANTLTDVYQLGVVLYQLLTDRLPFGTREQSSFELERAILEVDPPSPSTHVPGLRGDLDAIVLKAMQKEPEQRYASPLALDDDVRRYLAGEPVLARKQTASYRARRFARKHRWWLAAAAAAIVVISGYAVTVTVQRASVERALAQATLEARKAERVTEFMLELFEASEGGRAFADTITARDLLKRGAQRARDFEWQPLIRAQMLDVIGQLHSQLGGYTEAQGVLEEALHIRRTELPARHVDVASTLFNLGDVVRNRGDLAAAVTLHREAFAMREALLGAEHPLTLESLFWVANSLHEQGDRAASRPLFDRWVASVEGQPLPFSNERATQLLNLGQMLEIQGHNERAERMFRQSYDIRARLLGPRHPYTAMALQEVAGTARAGGRFAEADSLFAEAVAILRAAYPDDHPQIATVLRSWASTKQRIRQYADALALYAEVGRILRRFLPPDHAYILTNVNDLGNVHRQLGNFADAERYLRQSVRLHLDRYGDRSLMTMGAKASLGDVLEVRGKRAEAEPLLLEAEEALRTRPMPGFGQVFGGIALAALVRLYEAQERPDEAAKYRARLDSVRSRR